MHQKMCIKSSFLRCIQAVLFVIAKNRKKHKCPSTVDWINTLWNIHTVGHCTAEWMNYNYMHQCGWISWTWYLSKRNQTQKTACYATLIHTVRGQNSGSCGKGQWLKKWGSRRFPLELMMFWFLICVLLTLVYSTSENSLSSTFMICVLLHM